MNNNKSNFWKNIFLWLKERIKHLLKFSYQIVFTIVVTVVLAALLLNQVKMKFCEDVSICYSIAVFLIGIIITLKIRILDNKEKYKPLLEVFYFGDDLFKKNELVAFVLGTLLNIVFLIYVFPLQQQGKYSFL